MERAFLSSLRSFHFKSRFPLTPTGHVPLSVSFKRTTLKLSRDNEAIRMKHSIKTGLCFGLTSAIITTLGLIVGLHSFSGSKLVVIGGILTIAVADAFSDALGIHISEEAENLHSRREIWEATLATFAAKFVFAMTFMVPVLAFGLFTAIIVGIVWGLLMLAILSYIIARNEKETGWKIITEHLIIAVIVIIVTHFIGDSLSEIFS